MSNGDPATPWKHYLAGATAAIMLCAGAYTLATNQRNADLLLIREERLRVDDALQTQVRMLNDRIEAQRERIAALEAKARP